MPDYVNAFFEIVGAFAILVNCHSVFKDGAVRGVRWHTTGFFAAWGWWNIFYYISLDQWASFYAGIVMVSANTLWVYLLYKYRN